MSIASQVATRASKNNLSPRQRIARMQAKQFWATNAVSAFSDAFKCKCSKLLSVSRFGSSNRTSKGNESNVHHNK